MMKRADMAAMQRDSSLTRHGFLSDPDKRMERNVLGSLPLDVPNYTPQNMPDFSGQVMNMMPIGGMTRPGTWFHGTPHQGAINKFSQPTEKDYKFDMLDTLLGPHFAKDTNIANKFALGQNRQTSSGGAGQMIPMSFKGRGKVLDQKRYENGALETDQYAFGREISGTVLKNNKPLFIEWVMNARNINKDDAEKVWKRLSRGEHTKRKDIPKTAQTKADNFGDYVSNFDSNMVYLGDKKEQIIAEYKKIMSDKGFTHIEYQNTAPMEVGENTFRQPLLDNSGQEVYGMGAGSHITIPGAEDRTSAILLDQSMASPKFGLLP